MEGVYFENGRKKQNKEIKELIEENYHELKKSMSPSVATIREWRAGEETSILRHILLKLFKI